MSKMVLKNYERVYVPTIVNVPWTITYYEEIKTTLKEDEKQRQYMENLILDTYRYKTPEMISKEKRLAKAKAKKERQKNKND